MKLLALRRWSELEEAERRRILERSTAKIFEPSFMASIEAIYADVAARGDQAVADATAKFDKANIPVERLRVTESELQAAHDGLDRELLEAIREAIRNITAFSRAQLEETCGGWRREVRPGMIVGERMHAIPTAGLFVPCGKASYPSVLCQIGAPAVAAGVPDISIIVPPVPGTSDADPATLATAVELGITRVFRANGPAGIAALALGTESFPRVAKIVGPGSPAVTAAQIIAQRHGVATNMLCGPSESLVIADADADPKRVALDLLNEAEHGTDSAAILVTSSLELAEAVDAEAAEQVKLLPEVRAASVRSATTVLGGVILVDDLDGAIAFANEYASEHLQVAVNDPEAALDALRYAGEVLMGQNTPISASNFTIGVPATLPTGQYATINGGVTARTFMTAMAFSKLTAEALAELAPATLALADHEGFPAHANALRLRGLGK